MLKGQSLPLLLPLPLRLLHAWLSSATYSQPVSQSSPEGNQTFALAQALEVSTVAPHTL